MFKWLLFLLSIFLIELYAFQAVKTLSKNSWVYVLYWSINIAILLNFIYWFYGLDRKNFSNPHSFAFGILITILLPQIIILLILFGEDVVRLFQKGISFFSEETKVIPSRRKFVSQMAIGLAAIPFASFLYGIYKGKYNFKVLKYSLKFKDLPEAFDGYQITQISDIHAGSFDNPEKVNYAINLINKQQSDALLFTGDMVNNKAEEMKPYITMFKNLKAKDGLFSILGNHDYGDYISWDSDEAKAKNLEDLKNIQKEIGFDLLCNEHRYIEKNNQRIALIGVENWGTGGFKQAGNLKKATQNVAKEDFKILMTHDPSHWDAQVVHHDLHFHLTLSGHTHGMQFGIEIPGWIKWSPVQWRYKQWAGIYQKLGQYINVNRGFGYLAFPGRVGIWPEITIITLKKA
ncbi:MAG: metallophosphoesterase [Flavobacteriales bacterium]